MGNLLETACDDMDTPYKIVGPSPFSPGARSIEYKDECLRTTLYAKE